MTADSLSPLLQKRMDEACDRFETAWKAGERPAIEDYLVGASEPERSVLLRELLKLEIELRCNDGASPLLDEYRQRFADEEELIRAVFANLPKHDARCAGVPSTASSARSDNSPDLDETPQPPADSPPALPDRIGRYKVCGELGGGTFGKVYLARDDLMGRQVAIKVPSLRLLASQDARDQFLSEARSVARLQHEGIVRAYDFGLEADGMCYIVYEFIEGTNLRERIRPERIAAAALVPDEAARIVAQLAEALHYAHLQGLVHRDVKPANILLDRQNKPRLTDFGLAVREEDLPRERGRLAGTLPYMSPEQVRREGHHVDGRTDIYSLGVVLYELLCGRRPFEAKTVDELEDQILHREAKPPRQIKDSIPQELERVCLRALAKSVHDRYTTAKDMAEEIFQAIESSDRDRSSGTPITPQEIERRMASADEDELCRLLRLMQHNAEPVYVPLIFRCLGNPSESVRQQARKAVHSLGWDKVAQTAEDLARRDDMAGIAAVLDGLVAFEAHAQTVGLLDRLVVMVKGELRNRTILLLERKRLALELDAVAGLFRDIHSPYRIEKALGQGLLTASYLARVDGTELAVVVRVLRPELAGQPQMRAQFLDVNRRALQLVHENLVVTREARAFPERNIYFAVRDFVDGVTLQRLLEDGKRLAPGQIIRFLQQLLAALGAVHRRGMCHGGVKPSNIFVCENDRLVLGDPSVPVQGIGLALDRLSYDYRYAAPETFQGSGTAQSDLYSLGCIAYELACGEPPFVSDNYLKLAARHMSDTVVPLSRRGVLFGSQSERNMLTLPAGLQVEPVLLKLLARSPADRYARAEDVLRELDPKYLPRFAREQEVQPSPTPLLHDASLARLRGTESVLAFDPSVPSLLPSPGDSLPQEPAPLTQVPEHPSRIGDYDILEVIGMGGMGVVYKARDRRLDRVVALKVLPFGTMDQVRRLLLSGAASIEQQQLARFQTEARAVARLQHPNIVQIYDIGEHEGRPYVALEFISAGSLADKLREELPALRAAADIVAKLARAVHHAHGQGVLHRDLKPSNVLLTPDGQPKIADFGLAKLQEVPKQDPAASQEGMILGTPSYMAPEQAAGDIKAIGPATDIYGLGAILYESLTGRPPFRGASPFETLSQLAAGRIVSPVALNPAIDIDLSAICLKCLERDPQKRYPSAKELAEDLERWLTDQPIHARPTTKISRILRWLRRSLGLFHKRA